MSGSPPSAKPHQSPIRAQKRSDEREAAGNIHFKSSRRVRPVPHTGEGVLKGQNTTSRWMTSDPAGMTVTTVGQAQTPAPTNITSV